MVLYLRFLVRKYKQQNPELYTTQGFEYDV